MAAMRVRTSEVETFHEPRNGFKAFRDWLVLISDRFESFGNSCDRVHGFKARSWTSRNSHPGPLGEGWGEGKLNEWSWVYILRNLFARKSAKNPLFEGERRRSVAS